MNYLSHQGEFGEEFNSKLERVRKSIQKIFTIRKQNESDNEKKFHKITFINIDYKSTYACIKAILKIK